MASMQHDARSGLGTLAALALLMASPACRSDALPVAARSAAPRIETLGAWRSTTPDLLLREHLSGHRESVVVLDAARLLFAAGDVVIGWSIYCEEEGARILREAMRQLAARAADGDACTGLASVAATLLARDGEIADVLTPAAANERNAALAGETVALTYAPGNPVRSFAEVASVAPGAASSYFGRGDWQRVRRAQAYLRIALQAMPEELRAEFRRRAEEVLDESWRTRQQRLEQLVVRVHGEVLWRAPGLFDEPEAQPLHIGPPGVDPWDHLAHATREASAPVGEDLHARMGRAAFAFANESLDEPWFAGDAAQCWRHKRIETLLGLAVGVRTRCLSYAIGIRGEVPLTPLPELVVEPVPRTIAAVRDVLRLDRELSELAKDEDLVGPDLGLMTLCEDWESALAQQQEGRAIDSELRARLWERLLGAGFGAADAGYGRDPFLTTPVGSFRRTGVRIVRVPIAWRGEATTALAFVIAVERMVGDGRWEAPPWRTPGRQGRDGN